MAAMQRRLVEYMGLCVFMLFSLPVYGQQGEDGEDLEMEMFFSPAETVSSATKHAQPLEESPSSVTVLTREDIEASGARTLPEVLRLVPNMDVLMVKPMWYGLGVRGRTTEASDTMLLLVDGRDVTLEFFGFPLWSLYPYSMDDVERIEVIRGPGSALYGANALTGVVQIITREPGSGPRLSFSARGGEHGQLELHGRGTFKTGPLALAVSLSKVRDDLWSARDTAGRSLLLGRLEGKVDLGSKSAFTVETGIFSGNGILYADFGPVRLDDGLNVYARARFDYEDLELQAVYDRSSYDLDLGVKLYLASADLNLASIPVFAAHTDKVNLQAQHFIEVFFNRLTYGAEYVFNHNYGAALSPTDYDEHRMGLYVQDEFDLAGLLAKLAELRIVTLSLTTGLRFDYNSVTENAEFSPRAAIVYKPWQHHSFRLGYAHAFLKPTLLESAVAFRLEPGDIEVFDKMKLSNPDLKNQVIDSLELGYSGGFFDQRLILRVDFAYNWYKNQVWFEYDPDRIHYRVVGPISVPDISGGMGFGYTNDASGHYGHDLELQIIARPLDVLRLFFQVGYRQIFGSRSKAFSDREPVWRLAAGADLRGSSDWSASLRAFYVTPYWRDLPNYQSILEPTIPFRVPAALLLNARVARELDLGILRLSAGIEAFNLLGARFRENAGSDSPNGPDPGTERLDRRIVVFLRGDLW